MALIQKYGKTTVKATLSSTVYLKACGSQAATLHFKENAAKWYQAYKQTHTLGTWAQFCEAVEEEFVADDLRAVMNELLELKQTTTVEEYTTKFQAL